MNARPRFLTLIIVLYMACSALAVFWGSSPANLGTALLATVLALLAFHGSVIACNILAIVCAIAAQQTLGAAGEALDGNAPLAVLLAAIAAFLAVVANYLLFGKAVRAFQGRQVSPG